MKNFLLISPQFPETYYQFARSLRKVGFRVLGMGDAPYENLSQELKDNLDEYVYVQNMEDVKNEIDTVQYLINKYGPISYLESNNEYWLRNDAILREWFNIEGVFPKELESWQRKSQMKSRFIEANVKCAKWINPTDKETVMKFVSEVGFPIFIKPDIGVGAYGDFKINNEDDVDAFFHAKVQYLDYICEQYVTGDIISFDGICDSNSNVVFCDANQFPPSVFDVVKENKDFFYYTLKDIPSDLEEAGRKIVKAFNLKKRFFHFEFFRLTKDIVGLGKVGDLVALETNMRTPGGYTTDMINFAKSMDCYDCYAEVMMHDKVISPDSIDTFYCVTASRRDAKNYRYSDQNVLISYRNNIVMSGRYSDVLAGDMGNRYFTAKFKNIQDLQGFLEFVGEKDINRRRKNHTFTGEDIDMFNERKHEDRNKKSEAICDTHIDGA